jgi:hypothetical protein
MKKLPRKKLHLISKAIGRLHKFLILKIPKGNMKAEFFIFYKKNRKFDLFFRIFEFLLWFFYFLIILKFLYYFGILDFFMFFKFL